MIQNPIAATQANRDGIEYVIKRMDWYWNLSSVVLKESPNDNDGGLGSIRRELETQIVDLYKALLLYEIESVCLYYRNRGLVLLRDIAKLDDWNGDIQAIQNAERIFNDSSNTLVDLKKVSNLEQLVKYAEMQSTTQMTREDQQCMKDLRLTDPSADKKRIERTKGVYYPTHIAGSLRTLTSNTGRTTRRVVFFGSRVIQAKARPCYSVASSMSWISSQFALTQLMSSTSFVKPPTINLTTLLPSCEV